LENILRRDIAKLQVVALQGDSSVPCLKSDALKNGSTLKSPAMSLASMRIMSARMSLSENTASEADGGLGLRLCRQRAGSRKSGAHLERGTTIDLEFHGCSSYEVRGCELVR